MQRYGLPIDEALPALHAALIEHSCAVLLAPPGAGKSTIVPLALLEEPWARDGRILMLEPRRLATRAVAQRMAQTLGERVGATVGYRMRLETRVSRDTRIEVVTEGVFARLLQADPALEGVAAVIFDEFHERSLQADLGLALCLDARTALGTATRIVVMSATLDGEPVAKLLDGAPIVMAAGRGFDVQTRYLGKGLPLLPGPGESPERLVVQAVKRAWRDDPGDILVFLPGAAEIRRVQAALESSLGAQADIAPLFGDLPQSAQDAALAPSRERRRIVLSTNIAETSLTISGIRVVVDSGLVRRIEFDPRSGLDTLALQRISRASADQRRGRAGRVAPGVCYRLWSEGAHRSLAPSTAPQIVSVDLASLALELAAWGIADAGRLRWLDPPPAAALDGARRLLQRLGALLPDGRISAHGRELLRLPLHPRLGHMLLAAQRRGSLALAANLAAIISERDPLRATPGRRCADVMLRLDALRGPLPAGVEADRGRLTAIERAAGHFLSALAPTTSASSGRGPGGAGSASAAGVLLALAYPDRIARRRESAEGRYQLSNGRGAAFSEPDALARSEFLVIAELDGADRDARILLAAALDRRDLEEQFAAQLSSDEHVAWDPREECVTAQTVIRLDALVIAQKPLANPPGEAVLAAMLTGIRTLGLGALPWNDEARMLQARVAFLRGLEPPGAEPWPALDDATLLAELDDWLAPWLAGVTRRSQLARLPLLDALRARLDHAQLRRLDAEAPPHVVLPTGTRARIDYSDAGAPCASMRMQEVFGLSETPRIAGGRVPVTFKLLSPAQRPLQVTRDLASFWRNAYSEVRKDMRGRYPRHYWPENPLLAEPTRGVRRNK